MSGERLTKADAARSQPQGDGEAGWRLVPVEPTEVMICAGGGGSLSADIYRAMLAAAPAPTPAGEGLDLEALAASLANMVTEYVEGGIASNQNWRNGLAEIIQARLRRLISLARRTQHGA